MDLEEFCENIKLEYSWFLYKYETDNNDGDRRLSFPFCCHLSANLVSSYINTYYDDKCFHKRQVINGSLHKGFPHSWSEYKNFVIDFTELQFKIDSDLRKKFKTYELEKSEFHAIIKDHPIFFDKMEHRYAKDNWPETMDFNLLGEEYARKITGDPFSVRSFMEYVNIAIDKINEKTDY